MAQSGEIVFEGVSKSFTDGLVPAVNGVSFRVAAGNLVVLLGPSGCGKTTLLKMVNRLYDPSEGKIWLGGQEIHTLPINELRRHIGYVIQQVGLFPHMTIRKNIAVVPRLLGWDDQKIDARVEELLDLIGLPTSYLSRFPRQLSGGEQQRVGLARALAADPSILLMDEPFAAVDAINRERLQGELLGLHCKLAKTILFVTHDVEEAFRLADKIIVMRAGKVVQYGTPIEIVTHPADAFVEDLVGSNNLLRRLSLVNVQSILKAREEMGIPAVLPEADAEETAVLRPEDDLRSALSLLLSSGKDTLRVENASGKVLGEVGFSDLRSMLFAAPSSKKKKCQ
ncbi:MAG: ABC transporter ATP-binding protein [Chloroflexi bacterium]|nr:ABC transporter ATP-binding protein [Chloroflexota bacterium]